MTTYDQSEQDEISKVLIGRKVVKVDKDTLDLDDGRRLVFAGHEGGCSCGAGDYDLTELNAVDNIITSVMFEDDPGGDDYPNGDGAYRIFVFAENAGLNRPHVLATFEGSDGNGYYGTGYYITVIDQPRDLSPTRHSRSGS